MNAPLDKLGSFGAVLAAAACPICFPKLALLGALFGFGAFAAYEAQLIIAAQVLVLVALGGQAWAFRRHRSRRRLGFAVASGVAIFAGLYLLGSEWLAYAGFAGLLATSSVEPWQALRRSLSLRRVSMITCPQCGARAREVMPEDACQFFYECSGCGSLLRPMPGDCCVFCSYGTVKCPPRLSSRR